MIRKITIAMIPANNNGTTIDAAENPTTPFKNKTPDPPIAAPTCAPANISPFANPRSPSSSVSHANASIATSWLAAKTLCASNIPENKPSPTKDFTPSAPVTACGNNNNAPTKVSIIPSCAVRIHCFLRPNRPMWKLSTTGPNSHFHAHGNMIVAANVPIAAPVIPIRLNSNATAVPVNPCGNPSHTYNPKKPDKRPRRVASKLGNLGMAIDRTPANPQPLAQQKPRRFPQSLKSRHPPRTRKKIPKNKNSR